MQKLDLAIVLAGVLVVASALGGAVAFGSSDHPGIVYQVGWTVNDTTLQPTTASVGAGGGSVDLPVNVTQRNLTRVVLQVTVTPQGPQVGTDAITVDVTLPNGSHRNSTATLPTGSSGTTVEIRVPLASVPTATTVTAADPSAALRALDDAHGSDLGTGSWTVKVTLAHTGVGSVAGHAVKLSPSLSTYRAHVSTGGAGSR